MKKVLFCILTVIILLVGCTKNPASSINLPTQFAAEATITAGETNYCAYLSRYADGYWQIEMTEPAAVKGLIFTISGGNTEVSFDGLRFTFDTGRFPVGSVVAATIDSLDRLIASPIDMINGEDQCLATGKIGDQSYTLTLSKTKIPQKLELAESGMTIEFTTFDVIDTVEE